MSHDDYEEGTDFVTIQGQTLTTKTTDTNPDCVTVTVTNTDPEAPIYVQVPPPSSDVVSIPSCWVEPRPPEVSGLKDGGTRKTFSTGAMKEGNMHKEGRGAYHLLPQHPLHEVAEIYRKGAIKYTKVLEDGTEVSGARNWEKGIPLSELLNSAEHHVSQFHEGQEDENHLHQAIWNLMAISHTMEMIRRGNLPPELNDLPSYAPVNPDSHPCKQWRKPGKGCENK